MSGGVGGAKPQGFPLSRFGLYIQVAATQLVELNDSEAAVRLGAVLQYDITGMVDPGST